MGIDSLREKNTMTTVDVDIFCLHVELLYLKSWTELISIIWSKCEKYIKPTTYTFKIWTFILENKTSKSQFILVFRILQIEQAFSLKM